MFKRINFSKWWIVLLVLIAFCIPASFVLLGKGFYEPHDLHHFADIYQMYRALASGQMPPRWGPDFLYNFGYPLFNFYYVFPFYLGAGLFALIGSIQWAYKLVFVFTIFVSVVGMYLLIKEFAGKFAAVVGAVLFLYTPYRAVQIYVRGAMGEAMSLALMPLVAYLLVRIIKKPKSIKLVALGGVVGAIFILSHNYMSFLSFPWIIILALILADFKHIKKILFSLALSGVLMVALSAYWWIPALSEQGLVASQTPFPLIDHFPFIKQLIIPSWGYGSSLPGPYDGFSFQIGIVNLLVFLSGLGLILFFGKTFKDRKKLYIGFWGVASFLIMLFMMNIRSYPIWKFLPFHDFIQFPWRLLSFTTFFTAILAGILVDKLRGRWRSIVGIFIIALSIGLTFNYFKPSQIFYKTDDQYLSRFFANRSIEGQTSAIAEGYREYSEDYLLLPKTVEKKPNFLPTAKITSDSAEVSDIQEKSAVSFSANVDAQKDTNVNYYSLYFPGWVVKVDGKQVETFPEEPYGQAAFRVPAGLHKIDIAFQETPLRRAFDYVSLAALIVVLVLLFK